MIKDYCEEILGLKRLKVDLIIRNDRIGGSSPPVPLIKRSDIKENYLLIYRKVGTDFADEPIPQFLKTSKTNSILW